MIYLDATIINVALPAIQEDFSANEQGVQWVVAAYSLTMAMFIMSAATLADQRGRRRSTSVASPSSLSHRRCAGWLPRCPYWSSGAVFRVSAPPSSTSPRWPSSAPHSPTRR